MTPGELAVRWREDAEVLERRRAAEVAKVLRDCAEELERALRDADDETLTLAAAAAESGYSAERLRHKIAANELPNAGRKGAPRIRRGDLPRKRTADAGGFDAAAIARSLTSR